ncbi:hypothetical protein [Emcibacter sp.]|uniref:hypothetical protein n=1 Tax=Emcibacter sp. TaxID=1979954 RepID=UPI002AA65C2A|nr:hypothetical protein [Emcibacter sp.]
MTGEHVNITNLENGGDVGTRELRAIGLYEDYERRWHEAQSNNASLSGTPDAFKRYVKMVAAGDKAMRDYRRSLKPKNVRRAESEYERAREHLEEILDGDLSLGMYLDRAVRFDAGYEPTLCEEGIPRMFNSTSRHVREVYLHFGAGREHKKKHDVKLEILRDRLEQLQGIDQSEQDAGLPDHLQKKLNKMLGRSAGCS